MHRRTATRFIYWLTRVRVPFMKNWMIRKFIRKYSVDMSDYVVEDAFQHETFNQFFIRAIKLDRRPFPQDDLDIGSPVDGTIFDFGDIQTNKQFQVKNFRYNLEDLLGGSKKWSQHFSSGNYAIIYLAPVNYHRIHIPMDGVLEYEHYIPGDFFSVNARTIKNIPHVFSRNERLVTVFNTSMGKVAIILVGALFVAGMETVWKKEYRDALERTFDSQDKLSLSKGDELGRFNMGSTVILLFENNQITWKDIQDEMPIKMGQRIARASTGD